MQCNEEPELMSLLKGGMHSLMQNDRGCQITRHLCRELSSTEVMCRHNRRTTAEASKAREAACTY